VRAALGRLGARLIERPALSGAAPDGH
jgi:hypothetical protein